MLNEVDGVVVGAQVHQAVSYLINQYLPPLLTFIIVLHMIQPGLDLIFCALVDLPEALPIHLLVPDLHRPSEDAEHLCILILIIIWFQFLVCNIHQLVDTLHILIQINDGCGKLRPEMSV